MGRRRVAVVGAGAAGLTAAIRAAEGGAQVTLLNAHPRIGLKILMSGGTRCNVTHREVDARDYNGGSHPFVARILRAFTPAETIEWMTSLGVKLKLEDTGKYFPESDDAETVLDALLAAVGNAGVDVRYGARVVRLERAGEWSASGRCEGVAGAWRLGVQHVAGSAAFGAGVRAMGEQRWPLPDVAVDEWIEADAVILATGGLSFPRTGSDGTGYALAMALGHTIVPPIPALTPLAASDPLCASCQGVTLPAALTLRVDGKVIERTSGSFLFAHFGYSGPAALDLSRHWLRAAGERRRTDRAGRRAGDADHGHARLREGGSDRGRRDALGSGCEHTRIAQSAGRVSLRRDAGRRGSARWIQLPVGVVERDRGGEVRWTHELRLKDRSGVSRVIYALITRGAVLVIHAFKKTTQQTSARNLELARTRLKEVRS